MQFTIAEQLRRIGIVPVIQLEDAGDAKSLARALCEGGLPCAEVTFRTSAAEETICKMKEECPEILIGAGTVLNTEQVKKACGAGAEFIVSPSFNEEVVQYCIEHKIPIFPGCAAPGDVDKAVLYGLNYVKFFPAEAAGGINMIKAIAAPYHSVQFMPTGGISEKNIGEYLAYDRIFACGGSWLVPRECIERKEFSRIKSLVKQAVNTMLGFQLAYVGISKETYSGIREEISLFEGAFDVRIPRGEKGDLVLYTRDLQRAVAFLERQGYNCIKESAEYMQDGKLKSIYMEQKIGDFAIQLMQKRGKE